MPNPSPNTRPHGFTLVELLVVMATVAILVALLLPAIAKARKNALSVRCGGNFRQMAIAFTAYGSDNRGFLSGYMKSGMTGSSLFVTQVVAGRNVATFHGSVYPYLDSPAAYFSPDFQYEGTATGLNLSDPVGCTKNLVKQWNNPGSYVTSMQMPLLLSSGPDLAPANNVHITAPGKPNYPAISARLDDNFNPKITPILMDGQMWRAVYNYVAYYGGTHEGKAMHVLYADLALKTVYHDWRSDGLPDWHVGGGTPGVTTPEWNIVMNGRNNP